MRRMMNRAIALLIILSPSWIVAQEAMKRPAAIQAFISVESPLVALSHVRVIDGTGAAALDDQTIIIEGGKIKSLGSAAQNLPPSGAKFLGESDSIGTVAPGKRADLVVIKGDPA